MTEHSNRHSLIRILLWLTLSGMLIVLAAAL